MIDTHCHIDDPQYAEGLDAFLTEQRQDGVEAILVPGVDASSVNFPGIGKRGVGKAGRLRQKPAFGADEVFGAVNGSGEPVAG